MPRSSKSKISAQFKPKVFVGLSGGVDSAVAACLLQEQGYDITAVYMKNWSEEEGTSGCPSEADAEDARQIADKLGLAFYVWNLTEDYRQKVFEIMLQGYSRGITPNPDVLCNKEIKFGLFLDKALAAGADFVATGHYAIKATTGPSYKLCRSKDKSKDQTYFLHLLTQTQLAPSLFPIGEYTKPEVREIAQRHGLHVYNKPDSQGICFIGPVKMSGFLRRWLPEQLGDMVSADGSVIGQHRGVAFYTIGQREGLGVAGPVPYYVAAKDVKNNRLIVAKGNWDESLYQQTLVAMQPHWISGQPPVWPLKCQAVIRYRQPPENCVVGPPEDNSLKVVFEQKQRAITPGQSVVFYQADECLGGAVIHR